MELEKLNIYQKILKVMKSVKYVQKSDKKVNGQYTFVTHDSVVAAMHDPLVEAGIAVIPSVVNMEQDGNRTSMEILVTFVNVDDPEEKVSVSSHGYGIDTQDKGPGKAYSYAYKYALLKMFCLETGDDPEKDLIEHEPGPLSIEQVQKIEKLIDGDEELLGRVLRYYTSDSLAEIPSKHFAELEKNLKVERKKRNANS